MNSTVTRGFSLIELMVVVVVVGILASIALPSYRNYIVRSSRTAAQTELLQMAGLQEKIYLNSSAYSPNVNSAYNGTSTGGLGKTDGKTADDKYSLSLQDGGQTYTLIATPIVGTTQEGNGCLTIQENSLKQWHENNDACNSATPNAWK